MLNSSSKYKFIVYPIIAIIYGVLFHYHVESLTDGKISAVSILAMIGLFWLAALSTGIVKVIVHLLER